MLICVNAVGLISNFQKHYVYLMIEIGYKELRLKKYKLSHEIAEWYRGIHTNWLKKGAMDLILL